MNDRLRDLVDPILLNWLPEGLRHALDGALLAGSSPQEILARIARRTGRDSLTYLACWAYLEHQWEGSIDEEHQPDSAINPQIFE